MPQPQKVCLASFMDAGNPNNTIARALDDSDIPMTVVYVTIYSGTPEKKQALSDAIRDAHLLVVTMSSVCRDKSSNAPSLLEHALTEAKACGIPIGIMFDSPSDLNIEYLRTHDDMRVLVRLLVGGKACAPDDVTDVAQKLFAHLKPASCFLLNTGRTDGNRVEEIQQAIRQLLRESSASEEAHMDEMILTPPVLNRGERFGYVP